MFIITIILIRRIPSIHIINLLQTVLTIHAQIQVITAVKPQLLLLTIQEAAIVKVQNFCDNL